MSSLAESSAVDERPVIQFDEEEEEEEEGEGEGEGEDEEEEEEVEDADEDEDDDEFDEATKKELEIYYKQIIETEGFGVTYRPKAVGIGGINPLNLETFGDLPDIIECACFAIDDHNKKQKDGDEVLVFSRLLHVTCGLTADVIFYITFEAMNQSSKEKNIYESKVISAFDYSKEVFIFRRKSFKDQDCFFELKL